MKTETIQYRWLNKSDLVKLAEIDRSEHITLAYNQEGSQLTTMAVDWQVPAWLSGGDGDHSVNHIIDFGSEHLERGGIMKGAVFDDLLIGVGILQPDIRPSMDQLAFLHVSREYRRQGIASEIARDLCHLARERGAKSVYVSATPSESAVSFYRNHGFEPVTDPIPELYALEPEDIHMILELEPR
jgi:ribosomal protein S18 acetylase RimI-like enzyme